MAKEHEVSPQGQPGGTPEPSSSEPTPSVAGRLFGARLSLAEQYVAALRSTGIEHGLVGPREADRMWERHVINCALAAGSFDPDSAIADLGTGAGLPGIVLAIARPDLHVHLVEPLHRRIVWLERTVAALHLTNVTLHEDRAESVAGQLQVRHTTARAVARLAALTLWSRPLLAEGGSLIAVKGASAETELAADWPAMQRAGAGRAQVQVVGDELVTAGIVGEPTRIVEVTFEACPSPGVARRSATRPLRATTPSRRGTREAGRRRRERE